MTALAVTTDHVAGPSGGWGARLVVTDDADVVVGWVDLAHSRRHVSDPLRAEQFHEAVDLWLQIVTPAGPDAVTPPQITHPLRVTETRFPDAKRRRTLVMPLSHSA